MLLAVERDGWEIGVTLLVGGVIITGTLTPAIRYHEWAASHVEIAAALGGLTTQTTAVPAITAEEAQRARDAWRATLASEGLDPDSEEGQAARLRLGAVYLRNAIVEAGPLRGAGWRQYSFLAIATHAVQACTPMNTGPMILLPIEGET